MKQSLYIITLLLIFCNHSFAQNNSEYYFKFEVEDKTELNTITQIISIDNVKKNEIFAYANQQEFDKFSELGYKVEFLQKDIPKSLTMATTVSQMANWDRYPTYEVYRQMMKNFESSYSSICKLDSFGTTVNGRQLYVLKISDNVNIEENEPEFFYTSTMHGDETTGYILMLRLADSLLSTYSTSDQIENLVNEVEIYINPNGNPDGTYYGGNNTVSSARRYNANGADLNRDFPDPRVGANAPYQPETQAMIDFAENHHFVMSANFHGGEDVLNYPWDTWYYSENPHADTEWFEQVCTDYVATARNINSSYLNGISGDSDGVTHGATWYKVAGGRQDYMNYWHQCREITMEVSVSKLLATESLNTYWNYNKQALLNFLDECLYGIRGTVKNTKGDPLDAMIWVINHDETNDSSMVFTDSDHGNYHRLIEPGTYDIVASSEEYKNDTAKNIVVNKGEVIWVNLELTSIYDTIALNTNPKFIHDTLYFDQENTHEILIYNDSLATLTSYDIEIENESENSWITLDKSSGNIIGSENDTVNISLNTDILQAGIYNTNIIITAADSETNSIPIYLFVKDTISTKITPELIIDTVWAGDNSVYDIMIENNGLLSLNYSLNIEEENNKPWLSINKQSGNLSITECDTIKASVYTQDYGFGDFNTNIIVAKEHSTNDTIPILIFVKDTINFEVDPLSLSDTLKQDTIISHNFTIRNTGNTILKYVAALDFQDEEDEWLSLENETNEIIANNSTTVTVHINTIKLNSGDYTCNLHIFETNGKSYLIPIHIHVKLAQLIDNIMDILKLQVYPNPFLNELYINIHNAENDFVEMKIYNICGNLVFQNKLNFSEYPVLLNDYFNIHNMVKGIYFIQISSSNYQSTIKVIKY